MNLDKVEFTNRVNLDVWLNEKEWTMTMLHQKSNIEPHTLSNIRKSGKASFKSLEALSETFGVPIPYLFIKTPKLLK